MKKKLTLPLILIAALGLGYLIATLVLNHYLSEERLRVMLIDPAEAQLGRKVDIGSIDVSLFSGIDIEDIAIHGKNPGEDFISIAAFHLTYKLLPLLQKRLVITQISIDQPTFNLSRDANGAFNIADLSLKPKKVERENLPPEEQDVEPLPLTLVFDKITIDDANLTFTDQTGKLPEIISGKGDLNLSLALADKLAESRYQGILKLIVNASYKGHKPVLIMNCDFNEKQASFKGDLNVDFEKMFFNGKLLNPLSAPDLTLNLQSPSLDLAKLANLNNDTEKTAPTPADNVAIPPAAEAEPDTHAAPMNVIPESPAAIDTMPASPPPFSTDTGNFSAHGQITVARLQQGKLALQELNLTYTFKDRQLALDNVSFGIFGGKVTSQLKIDVSRPAPDFQGEIKASKLRMAEAMANLDKPAEYLSGELSAELVFQGYGRSWPVIRNSLDGDGNFSLVKGGLADSPYSRALATILDIPELNALTFDELAGTVSISEGNIALVCTMSSPALDLQAKGSAGMDETLNLPLTIRLSQENSQRLLEKSKYAGYLADESGRTTLNLRLTGTIGQPQLALDSNTTGRQVQKVLEKKASEELSRAIAKQLGGSEDAQKKDAAEDLSNRFLNQMLNN